MMRGTVQKPPAVNAKYGQQARDQGGAESKNIPTLEELVKKRDFLGAVTLLQFKRHTQSSSKNNEWLAYCLFHAGQYAKALQIYEALLQRDEPELEAHNYAAACHFYTGNYAEAQRLANLGPKSTLQNRILFHCVHAMGDEDQLLQYHAKLTTCTEDQLSLAAIHFRRSHFQEATDIYKRILVEHKDYAALNIYIALCYSRLDYYDVSQDILKQYLTQYPDSLLAMNLKACNTFRLSDGKKAEAELQAFKAQTSTPIQDNELIRHNLVVFRGGENAMRDLVPLVGLIPEARLNLVIYYLRKGETQAAFDLMKDVEPTQPQEYILKGVVHAVVGQTKNDAEHLKYAQQYFQLVGASASECDTIPGRQCMASCFFLLKQFDDVLIFLSSIRQYFLEDDDYNWNYAIALASVGKHAEAIKAFASIKSESYRKEFCFNSWLARCYINVNQPQEAWKLYLRMEMSDDSYNMLHLIANDCYAMGQFFYSAKAFQVLERLDPDTKFFEGKRGACIGYWQLLLAGQESRDRFHEVVNIMKDSTSAHAVVVTQKMKQWAAANGLQVT